jgi:hypothetical protein
VSTLLKVFFMIAIALVVTSKVFSSPPATLTLKERFHEARSGDYVVVSQSHNYTLFHIYEKTQNAVVIEEVNVPEAQIPQLRKGKKGAFSWRTWLQQAHPNKVCWAMYELCLESGKIKDYYSVSQKSWIDISTVQNFLPTLLNLKFTPIPKDRRKKLGAPPLAGERDLRRFWQPPLTIDGKTIKNASFDAFEAHWPQDKSAIAGRSILIYLLQDTPETPSYFPFWIELPDAPGEDKIRVVDSGRNMPSPITSFPRRP